MGWFNRKEAVPEPAPEPVVELVPEPVVEPEPVPEPEPEPEPEPVWPDGVYVGRLVCDGAGNLCADTGEWAGWPVYHDTAGSGLFQFVADGDPSHNQRHHAATAPLKPTVDGGDDPHHERPVETDPHFDPAGGSWHPKRGWSNTTLHSDPDEIAATVTGHTAAYTPKEAA